MDFAQQASKIGMSTSVQKNAYVFLGKIMLFFLFLKKDTLDMISRPISLLYRLYDILEIGVLFALCLSGLSIALNPLFQIVPSLFGLYYWMIDFGSL
ncbi:MAG: hypothetical protein WCJ39_06060 [bacterium]